MGPERAKANMDRRLTRVWLWGILAGLPLVFFNGYFDITEVKTAWFVAWAGLYLTGRLACRLQYGGSALRRPNAAETFALAFCLFTLMASLGSGFFWDSFFGSQGYR